MSNSETPSAKLTGASKIVFWAVAIVALVWNVMGSVNFIQQLSPAGIATLPEEYQAFIEVRPTWALIGFAVSVIAGVAGAILLMMRSRLSIWAFVASAIGAVASVLPTLNSGMPSIIVGSALSIVLAAVFAWYAGRALP